MLSSSVTWFKSSGHLLFTTWYRWPHFLRISCKGSPFFWMCFSIVLPLNSSPHVKSTRVCDHTMSPRISRYFSIARPSRLLKESTGITRRNMRYPGGANITLRRISCFTSLASAKPKRLHPGVSTTASLTPSTQPNLLTHRIVFFPGSNSLRLRMRSPNELLPARLRPRSTSPIREPLSGLTNPRHRQDSQIKGKVHSDAHNKQTKQVNSLSQGFNF